MSDANTVTMTAAEAEELRKKAARAEEADKRFAAQAALRRRESAERYISDIESKHNVQLVPALKDTIMQLHMAASTIDATAEDKPMTFSAEGYAPQSQLKASEAVSAVVSAIFTKPADLSKVYTANAPSDDEEVEDRATDGMVKLHAALTKLASKKYSGDFAKAFSAATKHSDGTEAGMLAAATKLTEEV